VLEVGVCCAVRAQKKEEAVQQHTNGKSAEPVELDLHADRHRCGRAMTRQNCIGGSGLTADVKWTRMHCEQWANRCCEGAVHGPSVFTFPWKVALVWGGG
jgi:hypothetical protein